MKKLLRYALVTCFILVFFSTNLFSQEQEKKFAPEGNLYGVLFTNFHSDFNNGSTAFELQRAYLGYKHQLDNNFSANIKFDVASNTDDAKRFVFVKNALLNYTNKKVSVNFGIIDVYMFKTHEKFFSKRYIYKSFLDKNKFGNSADLGASFLYSFNNKLKIDLALFNGEGYSKLQLDKTYQAAAGLSFSPIHNLHTRFYFDYAKKDFAQVTFSAFIGYKQKGKFSIGAEYNYQANNKFVENHNYFGYSIYGTFNFVEKWEFFARYDDLGSNTISGDPYSWNIAKDGNTIISGIQFSPIKNIKLALNYQGFISDDETSNDISAIYFNIEYKF